MAGATGSTPARAEGPGEGEHLPEDRVTVGTRVLSVAFVVLLLPAFVVLYFWPSADDTARLFTWRITPTFTSMFLASVYVAGVYYFLRAAVAKQWHRIGTGFVAVACFAALMGLATILHWDKFVHTNFAFWLWAPLYWITPFWVLAVWLLNRRQDPGIAPGELLLAPRTAAAMGAVGIAATVTGIFLFLFPTTAMTIWPWPLTELTARVVGACFVLGLTGVAALTDRRWSSFRIPLQAEGVLLALLLIAVVRGAADFDAARPLTWVFAFGFVAVTAASLTLYVRMERAARA